MFYYRLLKCLSCFISCIYSSYYIYKKIKNPFPRRGFIQNFLFSHNLTILIIISLGNPKPVFINHQKAQGIGTCLVCVELGPEDKFYNALPLYHSAGGAIGFYGAIITGLLYIIYINVVLYIQIYLWRDKIFPGVSGLAFKKDLKGHMLLLFKPWA